MKMVTLLCAITCVLCSDGNFDKYNNMRTRIMKNEARSMVGSHIKLTKEEKRANKIIMKLKTSELQYGFAHPQYYNFSKHYFKFKDDIPKSRLYQIIKKMPKGAALHYHSSAVLNADYFLNYTYIHNLYVCSNDSHKYTSFRFFEKLTNETDQCKWELIKNIRERQSDIKRFDANLRKLMTLAGGNSITKSEDKIWSKFEFIHYLSYYLLSHRPVWELYFTDMLKTLLDDGIIYLELRGMRELYELNGTTYNHLSVLKINRQLTENFKRANPYFLGVKHIYTKHRTLDLTSLEESLNMTAYLHKNLPDSVAGFDLVGREDLGRPLKDFAVLLSKADIPYFFHAGETKRYGSTDENLIDALALGAKRIGHGFAVAKHPTVLKAIKTLPIGLEVNVVSNQVLGLVDDFRNHPLATYLAQGLPVILSGDDPGFWEAPPISHDFYITFVGIASERADIKLLKQLAINSLQYSAMNETEKENAMVIFNEMWTQFIKDVIREHTHKPKSIHLNRMNQNMLRT